jgi:transposase-like protein
MTKRKQFTVHEKLQLVERVRKGEAQCKIVKETGVNESTLRGWLRNEEKLRSFAESAETKDALQRKKTRLAADPELDKKMLNFFAAQRDKSVALEGPVLLFQAQKYNKELHQDEGKDDFSVSRGWLHRWKKRHGIALLKQHGESRSADIQAAEDFIPEFQQFVEENNLSPHQIYNCDETGLSFKIQPDRTLAFKDDKTAKEGFKVNKDKVTLLLCCNWEGDHKLKPLAIGKYANPRCFHHVNKEKLSVIYRNSKNSWMTREIFTEWFHSYFVPSVRRHLRSINQEERAVLLLDNCSAHPPGSTLKSNDGKITLLYLPKNTTSKIQPCDQGIIANFKRHYRFSLVQAAINQHMDVPDFLKSRNLKDAFEYCGTAWKKVTQQTINNCWNHALKGPDPIPTDNNTTPDNADDDPEDDLPLAQLACREMAEAANKEVRQLLDDWVHVDDELPVAADCDQPDSEIDTEPEQEPEPEPEPIVEPTPEITTTEAIACLDTVVKYFKNKGNDTSIPNVPLKVLRLKSMLYDLKKVEHSSKQQKSIKDFFKLN